MLELEVHAHPFQPARMQIDAARADVASTGHRDAGPPVPRQERAEDDDRRAHPAHQFVRRLLRANARRVDGDGVILARHARAQVFEHLGHRGAIRDPRDVLDHGLPLGQEGRGHQLQGRVLGPADRDLTLKPVSTLDDEFAHGKVPILGPEWALFPGSPRAFSPIVGARIRPRSA